jgi:hypothetical protein
LRLVYGVVMPLIRAAFLSAAEHQELLTQAGFTDVAIKYVSGKNWICAMHRRSATSRDCRCSASYQFHKPIRCTHSHVHGALTHELRIEAILDGNEATGTCFAHSRRVIATGSLTPKISAQLSIPNQQYCST